MSTEAQALANRRNAQRSTGPKTEDGKEIVSQNAVKHGLSARRDVIRGEDIEEFERHREAMLDDLAPVGAMESMLAQRIVSLSWRLVRAQRMQDAAIEALCANYVKGPCLHDILERAARTVGRTREDQPGPDDELTLGLAVARDFSQERALERLLAYEGRIEGSLYKALAELETLRRMRRSQERSPAAGPLPSGAEASPSQNKANSPDDPACSVTVEAYSESDEGACPESGEWPSGQTPHGVTTNGQDEAHLTSEQAAVSGHQAAAQNKANSQAQEPRDKGTEAPSEPPTPGVQNKANLPTQEPDSPQASPTAGALPTGT